MMKDRVWAGNVTERLIRFIPWKLRSEIYRYPGLSSFFRKTLNYIYPPYRLNPFIISAGPLKGFKLEINVRYDKSFWLATHEPHLQVALEKIIRPGWIVYDIGAYIGYFTLLSSLLCREGGKVLAFEPESKNFSRLIKNIALNNLSNVEVFPTAISDRSGWGEFRPGNTLAEGSLISGGKEAGQSSDLPVYTRTRVESLDNMVFREGVSPPRGIKIDVEGNEVRVLTGMSRILKEFHPVIICEVHSALLGREVCDKLSREDYLIFKLGRDLQKVVAGSQWTGRHLLAVPGEDGETLGRINKMTKPSFRSDGSAGSDRE